MNWPKHIYFVGIGGIGMSALARFFHARGHVVAGYDRSDSPLIQDLRNEGLEVLLSDEPDKLPDFARDKGTLVVRTPAVPADTAVLSYFMEHGHPILKRSELLAQVSQGMRTIAVAGTHGKTTTSSMIAHILTHSGHGCTAFIGGLMSGYESNVLIDADSDWVVLEADEFDRSFHHLHPEIAVVTSVDPDHLDIYGDEAEFKAAFNTFVNGVEKSGTVFCFNEIPEFKASASQFSYGTSPSDFEVGNVHVKEGAFHFDLKAPDRTIEDITLPLPGRHNVWNAAASCSVALKLGLSDTQVKEALKAYKGVKRRFEVHQHGPAVYFIDDYAHHPTEITACIQAVRELYPGKRLTVAFQPHLFSRTKDFLTGFAKSLSLADELILLPIYPAREKPIPGITSEALLEQATIANTVMCTKEELPSHIAELELEVLLVLGAGDIDRTIPLINSVLSERNQDH